MKSGLYYFLFFSLTACFFSNEGKSQTVSGIINSYFKVTSYISSYNGVRVQNVSGLAAGDRVLIIQMKGATINETNSSSSFGNISSMAQAGAYEFATICGLLNDTVIFERQLLNTYDYSKSVQLVYIPVYTNVTIGGTLRAQEWDSTAGTGGIIALQATGTVTMNAGISADSAGFKGGKLISFPNCAWGTNSTAYSYSLPSVINSNSNGAYKGEGINIMHSGFEGGKGKQSNGGGGGNNHNSGGGGGSNYGLGGDGGTYTGSSGFSCNGANPGIGGLALSSYGYNTGSANRIFLGGGGGSGQDNNGEGTPGGDGGGIVFLKCNELIGNNNLISANGSQGLNNSLLPDNPPNEARGDGGGGGGAGGVILLDVSTFTTSLNLESKGAKGSDAGFQAQCPGPGGGGSGGVIWSSTALPGIVTTNVAGGSSGVIKPTTYSPPCGVGSTNGADAGSNGIVQSGFQILEGSLFNCAGILSVTSLKEWNGKRINDAVELNWKLEQTDNIAEVHLEKRITGRNFFLLSTYRQPKSGDYHFTDAGTEFPATYRLMIQTKTGKKEYSNQLFFDRQTVKRLTVYPNPADDELRIEVPVSTAGKTSVSVFDYTGKQVMKKEIMISRNQPATIQLGQLAAGTYTVQLFWKDELYIGKIIKL